jgi:hypothetical protein
MKHFDDALGNWNEACRVEGALMRADHEGKVLRVELVFLGGLVPRESRSQPVLPQPQSRSMREERTLDDLM